MSIHRQLPNWTLNDDLYERWGKKGLESATEHMNRLYRLSIDEAIRTFDCSLSVAEPDLAP